jgi:peptidoglycan/xylan/chitin deacetylase (PgdA/CDA1 family)
MKIYGLNRVQRVVQRLKKRLAPKGLVLMYHRVAAVDLDPWSLCVTPQHFAEHLEVLQKYAQPMRLQALAKARQEGTLPNRAVAVTFDDGYIDNLENAKPLLERYNIPATVFITTGQIGEQREFWWDELERILLQPELLPPTLTLEINGQAHQWELGAATTYNATERQRDRTVRPWEAEPSSRCGFHYAVWNQLRLLSPSDRQAKLDELAAWAGTMTLPRATYRPMTWEEVRVLEKGGLIEVGAHTVSHPALSAHAASLQQQEIYQSKSTLETRLDHPIKTFAYPFGDYNHQTMALVQEAGFVCACSTQGDVVWQQSDTWQLPRFEVQNWDGAEFERRLLRWFQGRGA